MSRKRSKSKSFLSILILCVAVGLWIYDAYNQGGLRKSLEGNSTPTQTEARDSQPSASTPTETPTTGRYEVFRNCTLVSNRGNDGDSFLVKLPNGRTEIVRLYFVDTPESAFKSYGGGRNNHDRIAQQAADMGRITSHQVVNIGKKAKEFALTHLAKNPFTIHTQWDSPFNDKRYHAFVVLDYNRQSRFLHELLVEKGYARIHTKGGELPDGTSERKQEDHLLDLQRSAQSNKSGAWAF